MHPNARPPFLTEDSRREDRAAAGPEHKYSLRRSQPSLTAAELAHDEIGRAPSRSLTSRERLDLDLTAAVPVRCVRASSPRGFGRGAVTRISSGLTSSSIHDNSAMTDGAARASVWPAGRGGSLCPTSIAQGSLHRPEPACLGRTSLAQSNILTFYARGDPNVYRSPIPSCTNGHQAARPFKPPRPAGPPPPHILAEQERRREQLRARDRQQQPPAKVAPPGAAPRQLTQRSQSLTSCRESRTGRCQEIVGYQPGAADSVQARVRAPARQASQPAGNKAQVLASHARSDMAISQEYPVPHDPMHSSSAGHIAGGTQVAPTLIEPTNEKFASFSVRPQRISHPYWQEYWDEEVGASYFYNCMTREAQWVRPDGV